MAFTEVTLEAELTGQREGRVAVCRIQILNVKENSPAM